MVLYACMHTCWCAPLLFLRVWASFFSFPFLETRANALWGECMWGGWQKSESVHQRHAFYVCAFVYAYVFKCKSVFCVPNACLRKGAWVVLVDDCGICVLCVCVNGWVGGWYVHMQRSESSVCFCLTQRGRYTMQTQAERGGECIGEEMDALTHTHLNTQLVQWAISQMEASNGTLWLNKTSARIESHLMCLLWICFFIEEFTWNQIWSYFLSYYTFLGVCIRGGWYDQNLLKNSTCI